MDASVPDQQTTYISSLDKTAECVPEKAGKQMMEISENHDSHKSHTHLKRSFKKPNKTIKTPVFVPGRLCLLGEHTDWMSSYRKDNPALECGLCVVCATNEGLYADTWLS